MKIVFKSGVIIKVSTLTENKQAQMPVRKYMLKGYVFLYCFIVDIVVVLESEKIRSKDFLNGRKRKKRKKIGNERRENES